MALFIISAGTVTQSKIRTLSLRAALMIVSLVLLAVAAGGFIVGLNFRQEVPVLEATGASLKFDEPEGRLLIGRVGEISGRLVRLENEAITLSERLNILADFEAEKKETRRMIPLTVYEGKKPATPPARLTNGAGGPLLPPLQKESGAPASLKLDADTVLPLSFNDYGTGLSDLEMDLSRLDEFISHIQEATDEHTLKYMTFPSRPPVVGYERGSGFGNRIDPFRKTTAFHSGIDFPAPMGTPIYASAGGRVVFAGYHSEYGYMIEIDHGNNIVTRYAHCSRLWVKLDQVVTPGEKIAAVGNSGRSTGAHLHFEVLKNGYYSDPALYLSRS